MSNDHLRPPTLRHYLVPRRRDFCFIPHTMRLCRAFQLVISSAVLASAKAIDPNDPNDMQQGESGEEPQEQMVQLTEEALLETLQSSNGLLQTGVISVDSLMEEVNMLMDSKNRLEEYQANVERKQHEVDTMVRLANARQLDYFLAQINEAIAKELKLRIARDTVLQHQEALQHQEVEDDDKEMDDDGDDLVDTVSNAVLKSFETDKIMEDSERELQEWILGIVREELDAYQESLKSGEQGSTSSGECATVSDIVHDAQSALTRFSQDGIGMIDHAQGASVVYENEMTSLSYMPPSETSELLGNVWWRKYIPEDWERLLPAGWEEWDVAIPSYIYHSLSMKGAKTAPPETILQSNTNPGACWSMDGTSGRITLRLAYPVQVSSISLEHVSRLLVLEGDIDSAPKKVRVIGYPTCDHDTECPMGFDVNDPVEIAQVDYDWEGATIQTFEAGTTAVPSPKNDDIDGAILAEEEDEEDDDLPPGSCSIKSSSCGAPPQIGDVAAITVEILENWGNPDYTCLYRFRIHGEAAY